ncbi:MAG TPA: hypothetical protein VGG28_21535 [Kofleriaceae bacterium]
MSPRFALVIAALVAACDVPTISERSAATGAHRAPDRLPPASIHGAAITHVAVTERADVALTIDTIDDARLWPTLDGTREPVLLDLGQTRIATIAHAGSDELVIGAIDDANNASIVRVTRDGAIRGRVAIPGELAVKQLAAIDGGVIAIRADQSIERYDANGVLRGRLVGDPGDQFGELAVRGNGAAVLVTKPSDAPAPKPITLDDVTISTVVDAGPFATDVRFIALDDGLAWGPRRALQKPVEMTTLAITPDHRKVAVVDVNHALVQVLDASDMHQLGEPVLINHAMSGIGFSDNDNLAVFNNSISWWPDTQSSIVARVVGGAVGDHLAVAGETTSLELATRDHRSFLGWTDDAGGGLSAIGNGFALADRDGRLKLLDDRLEVVHEVDVSATKVSSSPIWIDGAHVVFEQSGYGDVNAMLVDLAHVDKPVKIGGYDYISWIDYSAALHQVAIVDQHAVHRFAIDPRTYVATALPELVGAVNRVDLVDPAKAGGIVAIGFSNTYQGSFSHIEWRGADTTASQPVYESSTLLGTGEDGTIYAYGDGTLSAIRDGKTRKLAKVNALEHASISDDGSLIAVADNANVTMFDSSGRVLWHRELWQPETIQFAKDQRRIAVSSRGGIVELDAVTGERIAAVCAFGFGLHESGWQERTSNAPTVCEDSP